MEMRTIPIGQLHLAPDNPRREITDLDELAASIQIMGILEPLVVVANEDGFMVVAGARRFTAAQQVGLDEIPVVIRDFEEPERIAAMLIENLMRSDLNPMEEAAGFHQLVDLGMKQQEISAKIGCSQQTVSARLALLRLPEKAQEAVYQRLVNQEVALALAKLAKDAPEELDQILESNDQDDWEYEAGRAIRRLKEANERASRRQELVAKGVTFFDVDEEAPEEALDLDEVLFDMHPEWNEIEDEGAVDELLAAARTAHESEPCHGVQLNSWGDEGLCTDPARHGVRMTPSQSGTRLEEALREATDKRVDAELVRAERRAWLRSYMDGAMPPPTRRTHLLVDLVLRESNSAEMTIACELLGMESADHRVTLISGMDESPGLVGMALLLAHGEANADFRPVDEGYEAVLDELGYRPSSPKVPGVEAPIEDEPDIGAD